MIMYRIRSWRFDVPTYTHSESSFDGGTIEECDEQALLWFQTICEKPENSWEGMDLIRIDSPAISEKTTRLTKMVVKKQMTIDLSVMTMRTTLRYGAFFLSREISQCYTVSLTCPSNIHS
jgi:hypothetical protein